MMFDVFGRVGETFFTSHRHLLRVYFEGSNHYWCMLRTSYLNYTVLDAQLMQSQSCQKKSCD